MSKYDDYIFPSSCQKCFLEGHIAIYDESALDLELREELQLAPPQDVTWVPFQIDVDTIAMVCRGSEEEYTQITTATGETYLLEMNVNFVHALMRSRYSIIKPPQ